MSRPSWTQPCCNACWAEQNPGLRPVRVVSPDDEICVYCGESTQSGIWIRVDPAVAKHPTNMEG